MMRTIVLLGLILQVACVDTLPKEIYIESRFSDMEVAVIESVIEQVNDTLIRPCLGYDGLAYKGRIVDEDEFVPYDEFQDEYHIIYALEYDSPFTLWLEGITGLYVVDGYATLEDVLLMIGLEEVPEIDAQIEEIQSNPLLGTTLFLQERLDALIEARKQRVRHFRHVALHEFGHFIGLTHNPDPSAIMYAESSYNLEDYQQADRDAFAFVHGCAYD